MTWDEQQRVHSERYPGLLLPELLHIFVPDYCFVAPVVATLMSFELLLGVNFSSNPVTDPFSSRPAISLTVSVLRLLSLTISSSFSIFVSSGCLLRLTAERSVFGPGSI